MKRLCVLFLSLLVIGTTGCLHSDQHSVRPSATPSATPSVVAVRSGGQVPSDLWVTAYYAGWQSETLKPADIDFSALTHLIHFGLVPTKTGTLDADKNLLSEARTAELATEAHKAGKHVLVAVGGQGTHPAFAAAIQDGVRSEFIRNIVAWVQQHHYDGVDVDMEDIATADVPLFQKFVHELRQAMHAQNPAWLLTAAAETKTEVPAIFKPLEADLDQINLMTYDMSGAWQDWETWYNSPLFNDGRTFQSSPKKPLPSCALVVENWRRTKFAPSKLGLGIAFYGMVWHGATGPNQSIAGVTTGNVSYADIMQKYFPTAQYHWDKEAAAVYLSRTGAAKADSLFLSYEDEKSSRAKIAYARSQHLGGIMLFELGDGYRADQPAGKRNPLLDAIHTAVEKQ